ncbi:MAG: SDR family NAD(P)-dependent oxidoreductase [Actinomycetes bacterium]|uniref:SDR family NAD(P)-dependent oxidoreductase n=1 Tax=Agrococcus TaxID=46352 RepID=UPI001788BE59|nr:MULTISPECIES: SDR family oxidoreductase [Agrococcus]UOW00778.1 SDR family oxidoreductase [Agrococcus sp. SCSIO52902]
MSEKRLIITGASSGIGEAVVRQSVARGWTVLAVARRAERLEALRAETGCEVLSADLTDEADIERLAHAAAAFRPTGLVQVAGGAKGAAPLGETTIEDWRWMFEANVIGTKRVIDAVLPLLRASTADGGYAEIMVVTSIAATVAYQNGSGYNAAKSAEKQLVDVLRLELHGEPIRVMEVAPGMVWTEEFSLVRFGGDRAKADAVYKDVQDPLSADDVAKVMTDILALPGHVSVDETIIKPVAQTHPWMVHKGPLQAKA